MNRHKRYRRRSFSGYRMRRTVYFLAIPIILAIMVIAIVAVNQLKKSEKIQLESSVEPSVVQITETPSEPLEEAFTNHELKKDEIPEIKTLMEAYFQAKIACDPAALNKLFGKADTDNAEELKQKLETTTETIENYENVVCYTKEGLDQNSYLVYVYFDVKFRLSETVAPSLLWCYVTKDEAGNFTIVEEVDEKVAEYIAFAEQSEDVRALSLEVNTKLEEALASDGKLASIYNVLKDGAAGGSYQETQEAQPQNTETQAAQ